jgi:outer membrane protein assembly factor BamB
LRRNRAAEIITIAVLAAAFVLLGLGGILWVMQARLVLGPTPTPTPTRAPAATTTPDFRATQVVQDFLTQQARQVALLSTMTPPPGELLPGMLLPSTGVGDAASPTPNTLLMPGLVDAPPTLTPTPPTVGSEAEPTSAPSATPNILALPSIGGELPTAAPTPTPAPLPTDTPTATATSFVPPTDTPTATPFIPTPEPPTLTPTPTATGVPYVVTSLRAFVRTDPATTAYLDGPSVLYGNLVTRTVTLAPGAEVQLFARTPSGEWVYGCCQNNQPFWVRQAFAPPRDNQRATNLPEDANPNDVRWLNVQPISGRVFLPTPTPVPANDYPLYRYSRGAQAQLPQLPRPPVVEPWTIPPQAAQSFSSPAVVVGASVVVGSRDNHLYSFDRENGNQRWRFALDRPILQSPAILDGEIFVADDQGRFYALRDEGNGASVIWGPSSEGLPAVTSFNVYSDTLLIGVGAPPDFRLLTIDRDNGNILRRYADGSIFGSEMRYPVIGDQLVYVAGNQIAALDVFNNSVVWTRSDINTISAGPLYSSPGVRGLAELYVVTGGNRIFCLDANTGSELWNYDNGERATGLAVNNATLFVSGSGYIKAISRDRREQSWRTAIAGEPLGGPWADNSLVSGFTNGGALVILDAASGTVLGTPGIRAAAAGAGAVSGSWVYLPGVDGVLYGMRGNP